MGSVNSNNRLCVRSRPVILSGEGVGPIAFLLCLVNLLKSCYQFLLWPTVITSCFFLSPYHLCLPINSFLFHKLQVYCMNFSLGLLICFPASASFLSSMPLHHSPGLISFDVCIVSQLPQYIHWIFQTASFLFICDFPLHSWSDPWAHLLSLEGQSPSYCIVFFWSAENCFCTIDS